MITTEHVVSRFGVVHRVVYDDGVKMILGNPSGSTITVTKSRYKFKPLKSYIDEIFEQNEDMGYL